MVYGRYNYSIHGVYKPTNITGGHHLITILMYGRYIHFNGDYKPTFSGGSTTQELSWHRNGFVISMATSGTDLLEGPTIYKAYVRAHFRILNFPLTILSVSGSQEFVEALEFHGCPGWPHSMVVYRQWGSPHLWMCCLFGITSRVIPSKIWSCLI